MIPPVVLNAIITSGNNYKFVDNTGWVGDSYILHQFKDYKIVDSAQKLEKNQFIKECEDNDLMIFSFYPTKPVGSCDGGMIVSNDFEKINFIREMSLNGMSYSENNWDREIRFPGYKMYMNSIQCDIALQNFKNYEKKLKRLNLIKREYNSNLGYANQSNHLYRINVKNRQSFIEYMKKNNVVCGIHYESLNLNPIYRNSTDILKDSESESQKTVSIPFHESLTSQDINYIITLIKNYNDKQT
jgi:dTDP-4-amino-4,6-dideoxygalactose transaminase